MAGAKTVPTDASVPDFLDAASPARRVREGHDLAELFRQVTGVEPVMWGPSIVGFGSSETAAGASWPKVAFSPRKAQLTIYGLKDAPEGAALLPELGTFTEGAGCVYLKKLEDADPAVLRRLVEIAWARA